MRATIDWSYDLLAASEQRVFDRLSVFANGCTLTAASCDLRKREIAENDVLDLLSSLVDKSLVVADFEGSQPRYRLLESFREYAREQLLKGGAREVFAHRHALAYLELAETMDRVSSTSPTTSCKRRPTRNWTTGGGTSVDADRPSGCSPGAATRRGALRAMATGRAD